MAKTALVTGASTGIGLELCRLLARDGYELFLVARDRAKLEAVCGEMRERGSPAAHPIAVDLARPDSAETIARHFNSAAPDVLINNAGFGLVGQFAKLDLGTQRDMIQVNVCSLVELTHLLLPGMLQRGSGSIMNVASTAAFQPGPLMAIYYATKSFVLHFSEAIAEELRGTGITVTALCPGPTQTEFEARAKASGTRLFKGGLKVMSAGEVAQIGYRAMRKGKVLSIAGWRNRLGMEALRLAPRSIVRRMVKKLAES